MWSGIDYITLVAAMVLPLHGDHTMTDTHTTTHAPVHHVAAAPAPTPVAAPPADDKREAVAKHELLAEQGGKHVSMAEAIGIRYTDRKSGEVFEYFPQGAKPGNALTMLALFGAKTKATNEASRVRNGDGGGASEQMEAIDEVFTNLDKGVWREKAEGGGGSRTDKKLLAEVLIGALGEKAQGTVDTYQNRLETEEGYFKKVWSNDQIKTEYRKRAGKTGAPVADLV